MAFYVWIFLILFIVPIAMIVAGFMFIYGPIAWLSVFAAFGLVGWITAWHSHRREVAMGAPAVAEESVQWWELGRAVLVDISGILVGLLLLVLIAALLAWVSGYFPNLHPLKPGT